jgi:hypothetical protein
VIEIDRLRNPRNLAEITAVSPKIGIVDQSATIALEVAVIDGIKMDERRKEPPVGFS